MTGRPSRPTVPTLPTGVEVASYATYLEAQKAVDHLSDQTFPVQHVTIVGTDLRMVERITGRLTYARVAGAGAISGAWFGLLISMLIWLFTPDGSFPLLAGMLMGAAFGILAGVVSYAVTGGKRDFTSASQVVASRYALLCEPEHSGKARQILTEGGFGGRVRPSTPDAGTRPSAPTGPTGPYGAMRSPAEPASGTGAGVGTGEGTPLHQDAGETAGSAPSSAVPRERPQFGLRLEDVEKQRDDGDGSTGEAGSR